MSYSFFNASVRCYVCGNLSTASLTTKIESEPGEVFYVGSHLDVSPVDMEHSHYEARAPANDEPMRLLETWDCVVCGSPLWIEVVVMDRRVQSITALNLDSEMLDRVHYLSDRLPDVFEETVGAPFFANDRPRSDWRDRMREVLSRRG